MQNKRIAAALALAVAITGTGTGFALPVSAVPAPAAVATAAVQARPGTHPAAGAGIAARKVNLKRATTTNLNLRQGKGTHTKALLTIPRNTTLSITETSGTWSKTTYKSKTGWVASRYLKNAPAPRAGTATYLYTTGFSTLRKSASSQSRSLGGYQRRAKVQFRSASGAWTKVKVSDKTGFMETGKLSRSRPAPIHRWLKSKQVLFKGTSKSSAALTVLARNTRVEWLRSSGPWTGVRTAKGSGWVPTTRLLKSSIAPTRSKPPAPRAAYRWTTAKVNLRKGTGTSHQSLGLVPANERVAYLKTAHGWSNVKSSRGTGWISNRYLDTVGQHSFAVYGTLRKGQSAYYILKGKTSKETKTTISSHRMYLQPNRTWLSYVIPSRNPSDKVVVERMDIKPASYRSTVVNMDKWERFDPDKPLADQNYNRVLVTDRDGKRSWAYLGSKRIGAYLAKNGIRVTSGDYLKRF